MRVVLLAALLTAAVGSRPAMADRNQPTGSVSCGAANRGALGRARALADRGDGFVAPEPWRRRGLRFGTDELVSLIERAALRVARQHPGSILGVADLSARAGGPVARHRSHQSGRDVDLIYYAIDRSGLAFPPDQHMALFAANGRATSAESPERAPTIDERFFDLARNWSLVAALATDPEVRVARIFVSRRVRDWLLAYARAAGEPPDVIAGAQALLIAARDAVDHQDHMHVRIACSHDDVRAGRCSDDVARRRRGGRWRQRVHCVAPDVVASSPAGAR